MRRQQSSRDFISRVFQAAVTALLYRTLNGFLNDFLCYDPFLGRYTSIIEAALLTRRVAGCDINPLSSILTAPRLQPPTLREVREQLAKDRLEL